jgi:hypothetical protein
MLPVNDILNFRKEVPIPRNLFGGEIVMLRIDKLMKCRINLQSGFTLSISD